MDATPTTLARGMPTKLTKDRRVAQEAKERMTNSKLYSLGQGYTEAVDGRNNRPSEVPSSSHAANARFQ
eukprot:gene7580-7784_t